MHSVADTSAHSRRQPTLSATAHARTRTCARGGGHAGVTSQLRIPSRTPSQLSRRATVCAPRVPLSTRSVVFPKLHRRGTHIVPGGSRLRKSSNQLSTTRISGVFDKSGSAPVGVTRATNLPSGVMSYARRCSGGVS